MYFASPEPIPGIFRIFLYDSLKTASTLPKCETSLRAFISPMRGMSPRAILCVSKISDIAREIETFKDIKKELCEQPFLIKNSLNILMVLVACCWLLVACCSLNLKPGTRNLELDHPHIQHRIRYFKESGNISPLHIINITIIPFSIFDTLSMDIAHDLMKSFIDLLAAPS